MVPIQYNLRNLTVRKTTTGAAAVGLGLVVFVFASVMMLMNGLKKTLGRAASPDAVVVMRKGADVEMASGIEDAHVSIVKSAKEIAKGADGAPLAVAEIVGVILVEKLGTDGGVSNVSVRGVPEGVTAFRPTVKQVAGRAARPGTDEVTIGRALRGRFKGMEVGQSFELRKNLPVQVVGVFEDGGSSHESEVWGDLHTVSNAFGREGEVSSVHARLESASKLDAFKTAIEENRQLGLMVVSESAYYEKTSENTNAFVGAMGIVIAIFFSVGAMIGAMITMHASVAHRQREIATLRALGFSRASILTSFLLESVLLALVGGALGALASLAMGLVKISTMNFATWSEIVFAFEPTPGIIGMSVALAAVMGVIGGFFPALRAARMNAVQAMRG